MGELRSKSLRSPDETVELPGIVEHQVELGDVTVVRQMLQPGWRWSTHIRPHVGGDWCQAHHLGVVRSGRIGVRLRDGTSLELGPDDVYDIPSGHDAHVIGDEPCEMIEWAGSRAFWGSRVGTRGRVLMTLLFTDLVDSTAIANRLGDVAWRTLLSTHFEGARTQLERFGGREVNTTGDGLLASFDAPGAALPCATSIQRTADREGLQVRAGVHVGEVEIVGADVRGVAVHEAARIMARAKPGEVLVSETTRILAGPSGATFEDRGVHTLKGLEGDWHLFAYLADTEVTGPH